MHEDEDQDDVPTLGLDPRSLAKLGQRMSPRLEEAEACRQRLRKGIFGAGSSPLVQRNSNSLARGALEATLADFPVGGAVTLAHPLREESTSQSAATDKLALGPLQMGAESAKTRHSIATNEADAI